MLIKMTLSDTNQDTVVFAANALTKLIQENNLNPRENARIDVGTESSIDYSKPISSFLIKLMEQKFEKTFCLNVMCLILHSLALTISTRCKTALIF